MSEQTIAEALKIDEQRRKSIVEILCLIQEHSDGTISNVLKDINEHPDLNGTEKAYLAYQFGGSTTNSEESAIKLADLMGKMFERSHAPVTDVIAACEIIKASALLSVTMNAKAINLTGISREQTEKLVETLKELKLATEKNF
jgi:hypothetical protein